MAEEEKISVKVYGQEFSLRVAPEDTKLLQRAAHFVDQRMQEIASSGVVSLHRIAMLTAIDIAFQAIGYLPDEKEKTTTEEVQDQKKKNAKVTKLIKRIDKVLQETKGGK